MGGDSPTLKKRAVSRKLAELRDARGLTTSKVRRQLGWSATKLNYIEKNRWAKPNSDDVADLCEVYGVEGDQREALIRLAREGRQRGWWHRYKDIFPDEYPGFEICADQICAFETTIIPGLLQVPGYIELITRASGTDDPGGIQRRLDASLERQKILTRDHGPRLQAVVDENAILRITDPAIRRAQVSHLIQITGRPSVELMVLPIAAGVYPVPGEPFTCLGFADPGERDIVFLESAIGDRMVEETDKVDRYMFRFRQLAAAALSPKATRTMLTRQTG